MDIKSSDIVSYRKRNNITQEELAELVGVSKNTIYNYENGGKIPKAKIPILNNIIFESNTNIVIPKNNQIKHEGRLTDREFKKTVTIIPMKAQLGLVSSFYAEELMQELETKTIYLEKDYKGKYYEIECDGYSMDNKTDEAIKKGDFVLCREVPKIHWENKLHINDWDFVIFHNKRGIIVKRIIEHNTEERKIICHSLNPDKNEYPDFEVYLKDCYAICNIVSVNRNRKR